MNMFYHFVLVKAGKKITEETTTAYWLPYKTVNTRLSRLYFTDLSEHNAYIFPGVHLGCN